METAYSRTALPIHQEEMEQVDTQKTETQTGGKRWCRKIRRSPQLFSPQIQGIDFRWQAYVNLVAWHKGNKSTNGNVFRAVVQAGISRLKALTVEECAVGVAACHKLLKEKESQASQWRREHLHNRYEFASDLKNPTKCAKMKEIIKHEEQWDKWRRIKWVTGNLNTGAINLVQCKEDNKVIDILEAGAMNKKIQLVMELRFELANSAPINTSSLWQSVDFCATTAFAKELFQGKVAIPTDIDKATTKLIKEMQQLWKRLHPSHGQTVIKPEVYKFYWGGINEHTPWLYPR